MRDSFKVDLSALKVIWDSIRVSDLGIDLTKYNILTNHGETIVSASKPAKVEIEAKETNVATETK